MEFNPEDVRKKDCIKLASNIEEYLRVLREVMYIPEELRGKEEHIHQAIKTCEKLIKKLYKGDTSVFKEWDDGTND